MKKRIDNSLDSGEKKPRRVSVFYFFWKRFFDLFCSGLAIVLLSPLFLILLILQKLTSKGPALYRDERVGYKGKMIRILKFRTMYIDANEHPERYLNEEQMKQFEVERKVENDPRITRFGSFLRKTSLDELPQLFNIFGGSISIVGPRPLSVREVQENFTDEQRELLLSAKPGLISNWGVNGRSKVTFASGERQKLELEYFYRRGLFFDLKLIFLAVPAVLKRDGAK